jgi:3-phosphoglycerate kinase
MKFTVYSSSASDGLTLASAASTGYSVASGGLSLANATAITTQITAMSSATGGCVLSLLDTAKLTSFLVLVLPNGNKISAQLTAGSYG